MTDPLVPDWLTEGQLTISWNDMVNYGVVTDCLTDWLTGSLVLDWLSNWLNDFLTDW